MMQRKAQQERETAVLQNQVAVGGGAIAGLNVYKSHLANPAGALAAAGPADLTAILGLAVADAGSAANALPLATDENKIAAMRAVEGGGAGDDPHKAAIRTALGLDPNPAAANHVAITADVAEFINRARIGVLLNGMAGANDEQKLRAALGRLNAATHNAVGGAGLGGPPPAVTIDAALTRAGL